MFLNGKQCGNPVELDFDLGKYRVCPGVLDATIGKSTLVEYERILKFDLLNKPKKGAASATPATKQKPVPSPPATPSPKPVSKTTSKPKLSPGEIFQFDDVGSPIRRIRYSRQGNKLVAATMDGTILMWDIAQRVPAPSKVINTKSPIYDINFSRYGNSIVTSHKGGAIQVRKIETNIVTYSVADQSGGTLGAVFNRGSNHILSYGKNGKINLWSIGNPKRKKQFNGFATSGLAAITMLPDGSTFLTSTMSGSGTNGLTATPIQIWDVKTGKVSLFPGKVTNTTTVLPFSRDGKLLLRAENTMAYLTSIDDGKTTVTFYGHTDNIEDIAFLPAEKHVITAAKDKTIRIWNIKTGEEVHRFTSTKFITSNIAVSGDGQFVVSSSRGNTKDKTTDNRLHLWKIPEKYWPK